MRSQLVLHLKLLGIQHLTLVVDVQLVPFALAVDSQVFGVLVVDDLIGNLTRNTRRVELSLVLARAQRHQILNHDRLERLIVEIASIVHDCVNAVGRASSLNVGGDFEERVERVKVAVDHEWRATSQVNVLLPPVAHVIRRYPRLENEIALQATADAILELNGCLFDSFVVLIVEQRTNGSQVLQARRKWSKQRASKTWSAIGNSYSRDGVLEIRYWQIGQRVLVTIQIRFTASQDFE